MADYKSIDEEVAAAEAALKSAQDRLEAARAKQAQAAAGVYAGDATSGVPEHAAQRSEPEYANVGASAQAAWANSPQSGAWSQVGEESGWQQSVCPDSSQSHAYRAPQQTVSSQPCAQQPGAAGFSSGSGQSYGAPGFQTPPYSQVNGQSCRTAHSQEGPQAASYAQSAPQTKDHVAAGLLAIFLGCLGIHKFYLGYNTPGFIMLAVTVIGSILSLGIAGAVMLVISIVEGIIYLSKSQTDFERIYVFGNKEWF